MEVEHVLDPLPDGLWLMDTGCAQDLINDKMSSGIPIKTLTSSGRLIFSTANGRVASRNVVPVFCKELNQVVQPYLLKDTPAVLSIGQRCMEQGFIFHWEAGKLPIMTNPEGLVVELEVDRNIPYLRSGSEDAQPRPARETKVVAISHMVEAPMKLEESQEKPCLAGEEVELDEDDYADSEELDAMIRDGGETPVASDDEGEELYESFYEHEDMDPEEGISSGEVEDADLEGNTSFGEAGETAEGISPVDPASVEPEGEGADGDAPYHPPPDPHPQGRRSASDKLRIEPQSMEHKLSHLPKNPFCQSCTMGKMKETYSKRRTFKRELTEWGEIITCDHVYSASAQALGLNGETETFVIKDLYSGLLHTFPVASKAATRVVHCIQQFVGQKKVQTLYSDNAK